ncbi:MAG: arsenate reductase ArsC [Novosphingobium sp.]
MIGNTYNVLFLCTGNSARSILAEALLNHDGKGRFRVFSAGSQPRGTVHPMALEVLSGFGFPTEGLHSKGWGEFAGPDAPVFDFIFTVCDNAAGETCPVWLGHPMTAHWGIEDPAAVEGEGQREAFMQALRYLRQRIGLFLSLPLDTLDKMATARKLKEIGTSAGATGKALT